MKARFLAFAVAMLMTPAMAADLPVKARVLPFGDPCTIASIATPLSCSGWYVGGGLSGQGSNADIIGGGINGSVFAGGITPTVDAGYLYAKGNWLFGAELDVGYAVATKTTVNGLGNSFNGFRITEDFQAGGNLSALLGSQTPITIPPSLSNAVIGPYIHVGTTQWQLPGAWANGTVSGAGVFGDVGPRIFWNLKYTYTNFSSARAGGVVINDDNSLTMLVNFKLN